MNDIDVRYNLVLYCEKIKYMLEEVNDEENDSNEGCLYMHYKEILSLLNIIEKYILNGSVEVKEWKN